MAPRRVLIVFGGVALAGALGWWGVVAVFGDDEEAVGVVQAWVAARNVGDVEMVLSVVGNDATLFEIP